MHACVQGRCVTDRGGEGGARMPARLLRTRSTTGTDACMHGAWQEAGRPGEGCMHGRWSAAQHMELSTWSSAQHMERSTAHGARHMERMHACMAQGRRQGDQGRMHARHVERSTAHERSIRSAAYGAQHMERSKQGTWSAARGTDASTHGARQEAGRPGEDACTARGAQHGT